MDAGGRQNMEARGHIMLLLSFKYPLLSAKEFTELSIA